MSPSSGSTSTTSGLELVHNTCLSVALVGVIVTVSVTVSPTFISIAVLLIVTDDTGISAGPFSTHEINVNKGIKSNNLIVFKNALNFMSILF